MTPFPFQGIDQSVFQDYKKIQFYVAGLNQPVPVFMYFFKQILDAVFYQFPVGCELQSVFKKDLDVLPVYLRAGVAVTRQEAVPQ
jgi:hypothetical protein